MAEIPLANHRRIVRELNALYDKIASLKQLINQFDNASEDKTKLEIAGRIIFLVEKVML